MKSIERNTNRENNILVADSFAVQNHSKVEKRICKKVVIFKIPKPRFILILNQNQNFLLFSDLAFSIWIPV
jgi:hypothetical protein